MIELIPLFEDRSHPLVNEHMRKSLACPECGAFWNNLTPMTESRTHSPRYVITCDKCKFIGPFGRGLEQAVIRWNKPPSLLARLRKHFGKKQSRHFHKPAHT